MNNPTKKKFVLIFICLCLCSQIYSQRKSGAVTGTVKEKSSGKALVNVNVFISGTTLGTVTNNNGHFEINGIPEGNQTLVISMIGYKHEAKEIKFVENKKYQVDFFLEGVAYELETVEITEDIPEEWRDNLKVFKKYFLGMTDLSDKCIIENEYYLNFAKDGSGNLEVECPVNITVVNNALGYRIDSILLLFTCNESLGSVKYIYHTKFTELNSKDEQERGEWLEKRKRSYLGSKKRFLRSVVEMDLFNNGYLIGQSFVPFDLKLNKNSKKKGVENFWIKEPKPVSNLDLLKYAEESKQFILAFDHYLYVSNNITGDISWLYLPFGRAELDKFGEPINPMAIQAFGSFANYGTANLLPKDYEFE
ncbi:MAG: carboxypeptidase-like regulatory domain-containing protein [Bacteroidota bacterium]